MVTTIQVAEFVWKRNDRTSIIFDLSRVGTGATVVDLTGASVKFIMRPQTPGSTVKINAAAVIVNNTDPARVSYTPAVGDTDTPDNYIAEWQVTYASGVPETFPNGRFIGVLVREDIAD